MRDTRDLPDQQWKILDHLIPEPARRRDGRGRPWKERRAVLNGILWVLRTGAPWAELPDRYPSHQTCHRRFQQWVQSGVMREFWRHLPRLCESAACSMLTKPLSTGASPPQKRGLQNRQNKARQRIKDHGCRRTPRPPHCYLRRKRY